MFARSYAEALGIDYERTIEAIREELGQSPDATNNHTLENGAEAEPAPLPKLRRRLLKYRPRRRARAASAAV